MQREARRLDDDELLEEIEFIDLPGFGPMTGRAQDWRNVLLAELDRRTTPDRPVAVLLPDPSIYPFPLHPTTHRP